MAGSYPIAQTQEQRSDLTAFTGKKRKGGRENNQSGAG
jgi:hypothetical protein